MAAQNPKTPLNETSQNLLCKSIFKNGSTATTKQQFTQAWIAWIDQAQNAKEALTAHILSKNTSSETIQKNSKERRNQKR